MTVSDDLKDLKEEKKILKEKLNDIKKQEIKLLNEEKSIVERIAKISVQIMRSETN